MRFAIIDDEPTWRNRARQIINKLFLEEDNCIKAYENGESFLAEPREYDVVIIDVEMNGIDGFETAKRYKLVFPESIIIILTTHSELMEYGYVVNAIRYVDKSKIDEKLLEALNAAKKTVDLQERIMFELTLYGEVMIRLKDIIYVEADHRNVIIHTRQDNYSCQETLVTVEDKLVGKGFFRCHRGYLVSLDNVVDFDNSTITMCNGEKVFLSVRKVKPFKDALIRRKFEYANS